MCGKNWHEELLPLPQIRSMIYEGSQVISLHKMGQAGL
jgi:hypothetical protein